MRVAVLGAGLLGSCTALELARHGVAVDLIDREDRCLAQTSSRNEGKIHLGYVYANDTTLRTARTMIRGGLSFAPLLRGWLGEELDRVPVSTPFQYVVHRDSLVSPTEFEAHLAACCRIAAEELAGREPDYFGFDPRSPATRLTGPPTPTVGARFATPEVAIGTPSLALAVGAAVGAAEGIRFRRMTEVESVAPDADGVDVCTTSTTGTSRDRYDQVVNALWAGRLAIDATAGIAPDRPWLHRVKHYLRLPPRTWAAMPSATIVLGPFGDTVSYDDGSAFLSWYPVGRRGSSGDLAPPRWPLTLAPEAAVEVRRGTIAALRDIVPAVRALPAQVLETAEVEGGIIVAHGQSDIDDPASVLHERHAIGPRSFGRFHTVDTGKLTTAPYLAALTARRVLAASASRKHAGV